MDNLFPEVLRVRQAFDPAFIADIPSRIAQEISGLDLEERLKSGDTVAVTAGSRGIANLPIIIRSVVQELQKRGARPFVIPAMGSHGGATAEGQKSLLEHYGVTEGAMGVPIRATMETSQIGETSDGIPVFVDQNALAADHIAVVNRVKPHTDFDGEIESGVTKMMAIGLGKHKGALHYHRANIRYGYYHVITSVAEVIKRNCQILLGLGVVENSYDQTAIIRAMRPAAIDAEERKLLCLAKSLLARLPFDSGDVLLIDEMGKDISGTGIDTNVVGRSVNQRERAPLKPVFTRIVVRRLSEGTNGNATGVGLADVVTRRLVNSIDTRPTYINAVTSTNIEGSRIPLTCNNDRDALETAISTSGVQKASELRFVWIRNTLKLDEFIASEAYTNEIEAHPGLRIVEPVGFVSFDAQGNLVELFQ
jgi:hypothetical protein